MPVLRGSIWKWVSEHVFSIATPFAQQRGQATMTSCKKLVEAAQNLCKHLQQGVVGSGPTRMKINGDTTLLPKANGLSPLERRMAWAQHFLAKNLAGTQQLRQLMLHRQFGARVVHGDCVFMTISPNPKMSALVLRLSRHRQSDPYIKHGHRCRKATAKIDYPRMEEHTTAPSKKPRTAVPVRPQERPKHEEEDVEINLPSLPGYEERLTTTAQNPLAVVDAYYIEVLLRLASILGVRMCPNCPRCNDNVYGCQDIFGGNMRPLGGILGGMSAFGGGTEHQAQGTPHLHMEGHVLCIYQLSLIHI